MSEHHYQGSWQAFAVAVEHDVMVPVRDGVRLATDIYFPAADGRPVPGPFPVLVERTPYDKDATRFVLHARFFARHGYVVLVQDVLGLAGRLHHGGRWRAEHEWPLAWARTTHYYLHADGTLSPEQPRVRESSSTYRFDPRDPVPTLGGCISVGFEFMPPGGFDQRARAGTFGMKDTLPLAARHDVLTFVTRPLEHDVEVTGPITVVLWASSAALDTDFTAKLIDVYPPSADYPDGYALNLTDSIIRARYRNSWVKPELLTPGAIYQLRITLYPTSNLFVRGHQIRLDISSSNFPRFDVNPNTGRPLGEPGPTVVAENTVYHDAAHSSHIVLPLVL